MSQNHQESSSNISDAAPRTGFQQPSSQATTSLTSQRLVDSAPERRSSIFSGTVDVENRAYSQEGQQVAHVEGGSPGSSGSVYSTPAVAAHTHRFQTPREPIQHAELGARLPCPVTENSLNDETIPKLPLGAPTPQTGQPVNHDVTRYVPGHGNRPQTLSAFVTVNEEVTTIQPTAPSQTQGTLRQAVITFAQNGKGNDTASGREWLQTPTAFDWLEETTPKSPAVSPTVSPRQTRRLHFQTGTPGHGNTSVQPTRPPERDLTEQILLKPHAAPLRSFPESQERSDTGLLLQYRSSDSRVANSIRSNEETLPKLLGPSHAYFPVDQSNEQEKRQTRSAISNYQTQGNYLRPSSLPPWTSSSSLHQTRLSPSSTTPFQDETDPKVLATPRERSRPRTSSENQIAVSHQTLQQPVFLSQSAPTMQSYNVTLSHDLVPPSPRETKTATYGRGTIQEHTEPKLVALTQHTGLPQSTRAQSALFSLTHGSHMSANPTPPTSANFREEQDMITQVAKCEELKDLLRKRVTAIASEESSLAEISQRPIIPVNLAIVSKPQQIDEEFQAEGHFKRREDFVKVYEVPESDITCVEMFSRAREAAEEEADRKFQPGETRAKQEYVKKHGNTVGVVGSAGIGKTTSAKKWTLGALSGRLCGEVTFIFYITIRFIDFTKQMTFLQFLLSTILPEWTCSPEEEFYICNSICNDLRVLVIFDGLDEAAFESFSSSVSLPLLHSKSKAENFLKHLAAGNLLPRARKIVTSRPSQLYKLNPAYRPKFIIEVLGLTRSSQDELGRQICGNKYAKIQETLARNSNLFAYCYVPVNFILTLNYLMNYDGDIQFVSLTRVLAFSCGQYSVTEHLKGDERELDKLAKLAWDGFFMQKVIFDFLEFKLAGIKECTADAFLNTSVTKHVNPKLTILDGHKIRYFSHLIWQEFFTAVYLMMIMSLEEFKIHYTELAKDRWEVVAKFSFGICDRPVYLDLKSVISSFKHEHLNAKKTLLKDLMANCLNRTRTAVEPACSWAHESNDAEIASIASSSLPDRLDLRYSSFTPNEAENLSFVLQDGREKPLRNLDLSDSKVDDSGLTLLSKCVHNIEELLLRRCDIRSRGADELSGKIDVLQKPLKKLDLSFNKIGDSGTTSLARCVHNIEELELGGCEAESQGADELSIKIEVLEKPLKKLDLSYNKIGDSGAASLGRSIHNTKRLILKDCEIKTKGVEDLSVKIKALKNPMTQLDLSHNKIGDLEANSLALCIHNFEELVLIGCEIGQKGTELLSVEIKTLRRPLRKLDLSENKIGDQGATSLSQGVHNIEELLLRGCEIRSKGMIPLSHKMRTLQVPMKKLDLSRNMICDLGATLLSHCISHIEELELDGCEIGNKGVKEIAKRIQSLHQPMERLDLTWNNLTDESAESLAGCVHNIKALCVSDCGFTKAGMSLIKSKTRGKDSTNYRYI